MSDPVKHVLDEAYELQATTLKEAKQENTRLRAIIRALSTKRRAGSVELQVMPETPTAWRFVVCVPDADEVEIARQFHHALNDAAQHWMDNAIAIARQTEKDGAA